MHRQHGRPGQLDHLRRLPNANPIPEDFHPLRLDRPAILEEENHRRSTGGRQDPRAGHEQRKAQRPFKSAPRAFLHLTGQGFPTQGPLESSSRRIMPFPLMTCRRLTGSPGNSAFRSRPQAPGPLSRRRISGRVRRGEGGRGRRCRWRRRCGGVQLGNPREPVPLRVHALLIGYVVPPLPGRPAESLPRPLLAERLIGLELLQSFPGPRQHHDARPQGRWGAPAQHAGNHERKEEPRVFARTLPAPSRGPGGPAGGPQSASRRDIP
jgi:hypothetical protein